MPDTAERSLGVILTTNPIFAPFSARRCGRLLEGECTMLRMQGVLNGFIVIGTIVAVGYLLGRFRLLGEYGRDVLAKLAFFVASPALLFQLLSTTRPESVFTPVFLVTIIATGFCAAIFIAVGIIKRWGAARTAVGTMCASYVNAGNLGIPIAAYVLGNAALIAPVMMFQLLIYTPVAVTVIDLAKSSRASIWRTVSAPLRNPIVIGAVGGLAAALTGWEPSGPFADAVGALAGMAVPALLLAYGISLHGGTIPGRGADRELLGVALVLKIVVQPLVAWLLGQFVFDLDSAGLLAVVVFAALPTAQNIFTYAVHYKVAVTLARDAIMVSTAISPFLLAGAAALLK
jgi:malonate transporter and related proteins